jgi:sugar phosphate isomerase/epimerase
MRRRDFIKLATAAPFFPQINSVVSGVRLGAITYSFRELPRTPGASDAVDVMIKALTECGIGEIELFSPHAEPTQRSREQMREWRLTTPMSYFSDIRKRFNDAGITLYAYTVNFRNDYTDAELDKSFEQANALGVTIIAASTQMSVSQRLVPFAEKHKINVALHGHSNLTNPEEFASPDSFSKALKMSKYFKINLDIGHFTAANFDAVQYIRSNHDQITHLHMKDRKKDQGANVPWGEGDTPIKEVLALLKQMRSPIRAFVEYEHRGTGTPIDEVKKCMAYMQQALA